MNGSLERLIAYLANRTDRLRDVLHQERAVVMPPPAEDARAWGIGFYQGDEILHKKRPLGPGEPADDIGADLRTDCAVLHLNQRVRGSFRTLDVGPFRFRRWSYAQMGGEDNSALLSAPLPDFLARAVAGTATSERFFHRVLAHLHEAGALDHGNAPSAVVLAAIRATATEAARDAGAAPWAAVMTSGEQTYGISCGLPIYHVHRRGLVESADGGRGADNAKAVQLRYTLLVAGVDETPPSPYDVLADSSVAIVERDLSLSVHPL